MGVNHKPVNAAAVDLHIEELVLHGFPAADRFRMGDAVERELVRLIAEQGLPGLARNQVNIERLDSGAFMVAAGAKPHAVGVQLAQNLHQQLSATQKAPPPNRHAKRTRPAR